MKDSQLLALGLLTWENRNFRDITKVVEDDHSGKTEKMVEVDAACDCGSVCDCDVPDEIGGEG